MQSHKEPRLLFGIPDWLISYRKAWLRPDIIAGLTALPGCRSRWVCIPPSCQ